MKILITAGPTREFIDSVRYISNSSTGFFGYEIAKAAVKQGHGVVLISGPTSRAGPGKVKFVPVLTALEMKEAVDEFFSSCDCLIMSAAVADYRAVCRADKKIKKTNEYLTIRLRKNPDILLEAGKKKGKKILVGFALETEGLIENAKEKLRKKNLDFIVATSLRENNGPFGNQKACFTIIDKDGEIQKTISSKKELSRFIIDKVEDAR